MLANLSQLCIILTVISACTAEQRIAGFTVSADLLTYCDYGQTTYASDNGRWDRPGDKPGTVQRELNPLLGPTPSISTLDAVLLADEIAITATGINYHIPTWVKYAILGTVTAAEGYMVANHESTAGACGIK